MRFCSLKFQNLVRKISVLSVEDMAATLLLLLVLARSSRVPVSYARFCVSYKREWTEAKVTAVLES